MQNFNKENVKDIYFLSPMQQGMLYHSLLNNETEAYFQQLSFELHGEVDINLIKDSFNLLVERHDILRTNFVYEKTKKPVQVVFKEKAASFYFEDLTRKASEKNNLVESFMQQDRAKGFDLTRDALIRLAVLKTGSNEYKVIISFHHILMDGWCIGIILKDFFEIYRSGKAGDTAKLEKPLAYSEYIRWLEKQDMEQAARYWKEYMDGYGQQAVLPAFNTGKREAMPYMQEDLHFNMEETLLKGLEKVAVDNSVTVNTVLQSIWGILLQKYNNTGDVVFGSVISGRTPEINGVEGILGLLINTIPVRVRSMESFTACLKALQSTALSSEKFGYYPLYEIQSRMEIKQELINHIFIFENYPLEELLKDIGTREELGFSIENLDLAEQTNYDFNIEILPKNGLEAKISYNSCVYSRNTVESIWKHFVNIAQQISDNPAIMINKIELTTGSERDKLCIDLNSTGAAFPDTKMINQLFEEQAERTPDETAVVFGDWSLTYRELNERANQLARLLRGKGVGSDDIVGVMTSRSIEMIVGIMGVLKAGSAYLPIDPEYPDDRISYMLEDSGTKILLTQKHLAENVEFEGEVIDLIKEDIYTGDASNLEVSGTSRNLAYVIYTSGSTGKPKGVMLEHRSVNNFIKGMADMIDFTQGKTILCITTISFDIFVLETLLPLTKGLRVVIADERQQIEPKELNALMLKSGAQMMQTTPSRMQLILSDKESLDFLKNLKEIMIGGESFPEALLKDLKENTGARIFNMYGPTETTVWSTVKELTYENSINIGKPIANTQIYILDKDNNLQPEGVIGELCIGGDGLARGYFNSPELTDEKFIISSYSQGDRIYKTGDLARWLPDGNLECLGRIDNQVKIRGYRIELGEIEQCLLNYSLVKEAAVTARKDANGISYLCAYVVFEGNTLTSELRMYLAKELPEYMVPSHFVVMDKMPLTPNGKVDRKALPEPDTTRASAIEYAAPTNELEKKLADIWGTILGIEKVGIDNRFIEMGGHSVLMMMAISRINKELNTEISLKEFVANDTIAALAKLILDKNNKGISKVYTPVTQDSGRVHSPFPLTDVQAAYLLGRDERFELGGVSTHGFIEIKTKYDIERLNNSFQQLISRHPMLRTVISSEGSQRVMEYVPVYRIAVEDLRGIDAESQKTRMQEERERMSHHIFAPDQWPMFEFKAFKVSDDTHFLFIGIDMLIADASSFHIIADELMYFYNNPGAELPSLEFTFRDYILSYQQFKKSEVFAADREYWLKKLEDFPPTPALQLKAKPEDIGKPHFSRLTNIIDKKLWEKLKKAAQVRNVTPSALLCTAYASVLSYWSNQPHMAINLTVFNRYPFHADVEKLIGDFTSVILLDIDLKGEATFWENAEKVQSTLFEALEHRHYDGVEFIREIAKYNNIQGTKAIMPVVFTSALLGEDKKGFGQLGSIESSITQTSQVYLDNQITEVDGGISITWDYVEELLDRHIVETMFSQYMGILNSLSVESALEYNFEPDAASMEINTRYNETGEAFELATLHRMFIEQAKRTPDNTAVVFEDSKITYRELDERSSRIATYLKEQGVGPNILVGVLAKRCIETIANIMGILKAGGAYVPVDPEYPEERRNYILSNSSCSLFLKPDLYEDKNISKYSDAHTAEDNLEDIAYVIYTSGSTGKPKGVVITHGAAANTIIDINNKYSVNENDRILGISSMCFDLSVYDIFGALSTGAVLVMIPDQRDVRNLMETVESQGITIWNSVPAIMDMLTDTIVNDIARESKCDSILAVEEETKYFWSPVVHWESSRGHVKIGGDTYTGIAEKLFPEFYFITQKGITLSELLSKFTEVNKDELRLFIDNLIKQRVLVSTILTPAEVFSTQGSLFKNEYSEEIVYLAEENYKYKVKQLNRRFDYGSEDSIQLVLDKEFPSLISDRRTCRAFEQNRKITFKRFSQLLSVFKQKRADKEINYYYASAGGLYPIDIYIYVKKGRVEGLKQGIYYYCPIDNSLSIVDGSAEITDRVHYFTNKSIYNSSAFSIFMVYNAEANMPKYGPMGYFFASLDAGVMVGTLTQAAELLDMGICSIGSMNYDKIKDFFKLNQNQVLIHTVECGLKPDNAASDEIVFKAFAQEAQSQAACCSEEKSAAAVKPVNKRIPVTAKGQSLRLVMLSGDWIPLVLPEKIMMCYPNTEIISLGGATEGSIWSIYYPVNEVRKGWKSIPYGYPLANQTFYVLNYRKEICPVGVQGELYIGGVGVAKGYYNDNEKTHNSFIVHPELGFIYKTGDYGVMHKEGYIEFLGRKDHQIKIRGYRIEMGEIESCLLKYPDVKNAVILDITDANGKKNLCAYIVSEQEIVVSELRKFLLLELPEYMVPAHFVRIDKIPLTPNGKVDRKALPEPEGNMDTGVEYVAPRNEIEQRLVNIWQELLGIDAIGVNDAFFEIGGDSLKTIRLTEIINREFKTNLRVQDLFRLTSISKIVEAIKGEEEEKKPQIGKFIFSAD